MVRVHTLTSSLSIWVYSDHAPPHFHVRSPETDIMVDLRTMQVLGGRYDRRDFAASVAWASDPANLATLWAEWERLNEKD